MTRRDWAVRITFTLGGITGREGFLGIHASGPVAAAALAGFALGQRAIVIGLQSDVEDAADCSDLAIKLIELGDRGPVEEP